MFDFVLFENFYLAHNHYKDICLIARLLMANGYSVAIADVFEEGENCLVEDVPHIQFRKKFPKLLVSKIKITDYLYDFINKRHIDNYLIYVMRQLKGQYKHLYAGSYFTYMTTGWLKEIPSSSSAFFWGLRSARLIEKKKSAVRLRQFFDSHLNLKFFVSDELIFQEFIDVGISASRLVIRPERFITEIQTITTQKTNKELRLLSIGSIRKQKRVELCIDAIRRTGLNNRITYTIAGGNKDEQYESLITKHRNGMSNVIRMNYRIPEEEYNKLIKDCDFLVLCDDRQKSSVTNGTMNEALLKGVPIIAPNYNPYKYYVERYRIGLLFNPSDSSSLDQILTQAFQHGRSYFSNNIVSYQKTLLFESVSKTFGQELKDVL